MSNAILKALLPLFLATFVLVACSGENGESGRGETDAAPEESNAGQAAQARTMPEEGMLLVGRYSTGEEFEPQFSIELGEGWRVLPASGPYSLRLGFITPGREVAEGKALRFLNPQMVFEPSEEGETYFETRSVPEDMVSWLQRHPYLNTSQPLQVDVGGVKGKRFDAEVDVPERYSDARKGGCPVPCMPLFQLSSSSVTHATERGHSRFVVLDNIQGETVVVIVSAPAGSFDEFLPTAQEVMDSVRWGGD